MAISKISSSSIDPNVSLGDGFFKIDSTNNRVGIGTSSPASSLSFPIGTTPVISQVAAGGTAHSADNVGSLGLAISDGGNYSGVFVHNTHDGTFSSQDIRFLTAKGGNSVATERMRIDNAGRVTMPYQPAFRATFVSASQSGAAGVWVFDSVETNVGNGYNSSNGRFTAPIAGRYVIIATAQHYGGTSTGGYVDVRKNGSVIRGMRMEWSNTFSFETRGVSGVFDVSAGDYFDVYNVSGTASHLDHSSFSGYLLG